MLKARVFYVYFSVLFLFFTEKNPFIYQVTTKGFEAHDFQFFSEQLKKQLQVPVFRVETAFLM